MTAYFTFRHRGADRKAKVFVFMLTEEAKIAEARDILAGKILDRVHVQGTVIGEKASYNPDWSFHLRPDSITFFENQIEVCDANTSYVEEHPDEVGGSFLPRSHWCPWSSELESEVTA
jgi:hypothetical protein